MKKIVLFIISIFFIGTILGGCAPTKFEPYQPPKFEFEKVEKYNPDFSELEKPEKPNFVFLDENFNKVEDKSKAKYAALSNNELKKILNLSELFDIQTEIINDQEELVNIRIDQINSLKETIELKDYQIEQYVSLYANERNKYLQERHDRKVESFFHKTTMYIMTVGSIALAISAL